MPFVGAGVMRAWDRERAGSAALTGVAVAALGYALVSGLAVSLPVKPADVVRLFTIAPPAPPPPPVEPPPPPHPHRAEREGASAPPNIRSKATPVEAPKSIVPPVQPPPVVAATKAATGADATSGAAPVAGPGTGAGGIGDGFGSGRSGYGSGDGGTPARVVSRQLNRGDLPSDLARALFTGDHTYHVVTHYTVTPQGRVVNCRVTRSSGVPALDAATCQAMVAHLRYKPERDAAGRAIPVDTEGYQTWVSRYSPDGDPDDDDD